MNISFALALLGLIVSAESISSQPELEPKDAISLHRTAPQMLISESQPAIFHPSPQLQLNAPEKIIKQVRREAVSILEKKEIPQEIISSIYQFLENTAIKRACQVSLAFYHSSQPFLSHIVPLEALPTALPKQHLTIRGSLEYNSLPNLEPHLATLSSLNFTLMDPSLIKTVLCYLEEGVELSQHRRNAPFPINILLASSLGEREREELNKTINDSKPRFLIDLIRKDDIRVVEGEAQLSTILPTITPKGANLLNELLNELPSHRGLLETIMSTPIEDREKVLKSVATLVKYLTDKDQRVFILEVAEGLPSEGRGSVLNLALPMIKELVQNYEEAATKKLREVVPDHIFNTLIEIASDNNDKREQALNQLFNSINSKQAEAFKGLMGRFMRSHEDTWKETIDKKTIIREVIEAIKEAPDQERQEVTKLSYALLRGLETGKGCKYIITALANLPSQERMEVFNIASFLIFGNEEEFKKLLESKLKAINEELSPKEKSSLEKSLRSGRQKFLNAEERLKVIRAVAQIPSQKRGEVARIARLLLLGGIKAHHCGDLIETLGEMTSQERNQTLALSIAVSEGLKNKDHFVELMKAVQKFRAEEREKSVKLILPLIKHLSKGLERVQILEFISEKNSPLQREQLEDIILFIDAIKCEFTVNLSLRYASEIIKFLDALNQVPVNQTKNILQCILPLINETQLGYKLGKVMRMVNNIPLEEQEEIIKYVKDINLNLQKDYGLSTLDTIQQIPADEKREVLNHILYLTKDYPRDFTSERRLIGTIEKIKSLPSYARENIVKNILPSVYKYERLKPYKLKDIIQQVFYKSYVIVNETLDPSDLQLYSETLTDINGVIQIQRAYMKQDPWYLSKAIKKALKRKAENKDYYKTSRYNPWW